MGRIMCFDYGSKRTGVAVTDPLQIIATALQTVPTAELFPFVKNYLDQEDVEAFVVGLPQRWDQSDTHATPLVKSFAKELGKKFSQPVHLVDEQFTSKMAREAQIRGGMKKKDRRKKENLDKISAVIILQSYLEDR